MEELFNEAKRTAICLRKENPEWDLETLICETMECVEFDWQEVLDCTERRLTLFLTTEQKD